MLLEKRALWLRKEQARKKRVAEVLRSHPKHNRIPHLISSSPDRRPSNQRQRALNWLARACVARVCAALSDDGAGQLWMGMIQRASAKELVKSIRGDTPAGAGGGRSALDMAQSTSHR